jgi:hypothetical protein
MMGLYARAVGLDIADFNAAGEPFGIQFQGLPYSPDTMVARGYSLIHSVKDHGGVREEDTRRFFRSLRHSHASAAAWDPTLPCHLTESKLKAAASSTD